MKGVSMKKVIIVIVVILLSLFLYSRFINTNGFKIVENTISITNIPDAFQDFKIVQFSDLLINSTKNVNDLENIVNQINEMKPDIIVFTGDLIYRDYNISEEEIENIKVNLKKLNCTLYKYAIIGDNDAESVDLYKEIINDSGFILLDNQSSYIFYKDVTPIKITGITDINNVDNALYIADELETFYNIALTHEPDNIDILANKDIDLVLAGHSLLGQIRVPFWGGILKKDGANKYLDDNYTTNNTQLFVSGGLGTDNNIPFRLFNKPQINLYRLKK